MSTKNRDIRHNFNWHARPANERYRESEKSQKKGQKKGQESLV